MIHRERSYACIHPDTYKYFLQADEVRRIWRLLEQHYGPVSTTPGFGVIEIRSARFLFRAVGGGNPITVIRLRGCTAADVATLHERIGFRESP